MYAPVKSVHIVRDRATGKSRGVAYVNFFSVEEARRVADSVGGLRIDDRTIRASTMVPPVAHIAVAQPLPPQPATHEHNANRTVLGSSVVAQATKAAPAPTEQQPTELDLASKPAVLQMTFAKKVPTAAIPMSRVRVSDLGTVRAYSGNRQTKD